MIVYLVWDGYEDVIGVFLKEENADAFVQKLRAENPTRAEGAFGTSSHDVKDADG